MIGGFLGLFTFLFLAGILVDEEGQAWDLAMGIFWIVLLLAAALAFVR